MNRKNKLADIIDMVFNLDKLDNVPDQVRTLSQVGTSSYMAYAMQELMQGVPVWHKKFLFGPIVNIVDAVFTFPVFIFHLVHVFSQNSLQV